jgi:hypothetical protein
MVRLVLQKCLEMQEERYVTDEIGRDVARRLRARAREPS